jgi:hypothetical protein
MKAQDHRHTEAEERRIREAALDETLANSFPASDPASSIPNPDEHDALGDRSESQSDDFDASLGSRGPERAAPRT